MRSHDGMLPRLIDSLERNSREIDLTFATAGHRLGEGLELFEALKRRLSGLSSELSGSELARARNALSTLAHELGMLDQALRTEAVALRDLATHSQMAFQALERLLQNMGLITILARSARIEAVSVRSIDDDFGDFTNEIVMLTTKAQSAIQTSVRDHGQMNGLLATAVSAQRDFQSRYGSVLTTLAAKLLQSLAEVEARQASAVILTSDAAAHSGKIALAAGGAIIALQSGDSIRQRLEHAIAGLRFKGAISESASPAATLSEEAKAATGTVLARLESTQLRACATELGRDADSIQSALTLLAGDTAALMDLVAVVYRNGGDGSASFMQKLELELGEASDLLRKCDQGRAQVDAAAFALRYVLEACQQTVASLSDTVADIVLIGLNAGLRAARLGADGRSLVIIAQELKNAANQISKDASSLTPTFTSIDAATKRVLSDERPDARRFAELNDTMKASLQAMHQSGQRLDIALDQLGLDSSSFASVVAQARLAFSNTGAMSDLIQAAADQLAIAAQDVVPDDAATKEAVERLLREHIWPNYTMAAERTVYATVLDTLNISALEKVDMAAGSADNDADEFLF